MFFIAVLRDSQGPRKARCIYLIMLDVNRQQVYRLAFVRLSACTARRLDAKIRFPRRIIFGGIVLQESLSQILAPYKGKKGSAITALQKVQEKLGYLPEESISEIANILGMSQNELYGIATFYSQFRFTRRGEHNIQVCSGTACHVRGSPNVVEALEKELNCTCGETTKDGKFSLEKIACFGACALAPVIVVDKAIHGRVTPITARQIVNKVQ